LTPSRLPSGTTSPSQHALAVTESGPVDAPVIVLVHGGMDRASSLRRVARSLSDDFLVVIYDRRGYGRSRLLGGPYGISQQVDDLVSVLARRPAVVFGHSLGGNIALAAADRHPGLVRAVGAYEAPMSWEPWWPVNTAGSEAVLLAAEQSPEVAGATFVRRMIGDRRWDRLPSATRAEREAEGVALVGELDDLRRAPPYDPARIAVPILLAYGERGAQHHRHGAAVLSRRFGVGEPASQAVLVEVPGVGHGIHLEEPEALGDLVRSLAERVHVPAEPPERPDPAIGPSAGPDEALRGP
jgi:pimeloyl-ACP methyl ester carboxylesterase